MSSKLEQIAQALQARVTGVSYAFGVRKAKETLPFPRVIWIPSRDAFSATTLMGSWDRQVGTCLAGLTAYIYAATVEQAEDVRDAIVAAAVAVFDIGYQLQSTTGDWATREALEVGWVTGGEVYALELSFATPVQSPLLGPDDTVVIEATDFADDAAVAGDGVLSAVETT